MKPCLATLMTAGGLAIAVPAFADIFVPVSTFHVFEVEGWLFQCLGHDDNVGACSAERVINDVSVQLSFDRKPGSVELVSKIEGVCEHAQGTDEARLDPAVAGPYQVSQFVNELAGAVERKHSACGQEGALTGVRESILIATSAILGFERAPPL